MSLVPSIYILEVESEIVDGLDHEGDPFRARESKIVSWFSDYNGAFTHLNNDELDHTQGGKYLRANIYNWKLGEDNVEDVYRETFVIVYPHSNWVNQKEFVEDLYNNLLEIASEG